MRILLMLCLAALAGCGIKGDPLPVEDEPEPGITLSGRAEIGVVYGN